MAAILRPGKTPGGTEVRTVVRHVVRRIRRHWPEVAILLRGDSHCARPEAMDWCEANRIDYMLGLAGNAVLHARVRDVADDLCVRRAEAGGEDKRRTWSEFRYAAKSWATERRVVARLEVSTLGLDRRYVVTTLTERGLHNGTRHHARAEGAWRTGDHGVELDRYAAQPAMVGRQSPSSQPPAVAASSDATTPSALSANSIPSRSPIAMSSSCPKP